MKGNCFVDTNILIYAHTDLETHEQVVAQKLLKSDRLFVSTHVLMELSNVFSKRIIKDWNITSKIIKETINYFNIHIVDVSTINFALSIASRYKYSYYDALIIASALESNCNTLYSDNLQA